MDNSSNAPYGVNIIQNGDLKHDLAEWVPFGCCTLNISNEQPATLPPIQETSLKPDCHKNINPNYILASRRADSCAGPAQFVTEKVMRNVTYLVSSWVRVGPGAFESQKISVSLCVDDEWIEAGRVCADVDEWYEIRGSFRLERIPCKVMVCVSGPEPGVDFCVRSLSICATDRKARFEYLKQKTDEVRKRDVILKFDRQNGINDLIDSSIKITQVYNSFPFGSCISRTGINNGNLADFFVKNFNSAVFENELKWYCTEAQRGEINYSDSDFLLEFCQKHEKPVRGHCIFWEKEDMVQQWIKSLDRDDLMSCVQNRLTSLLTRYKGKFMHYDVNNEMLHGSFYRDRLGQDIPVFMFQEANRLDPFATLFVNDYNVEDESYPDSTPEKYIEQILDLQRKGAEVGGIGVQGHLTNPNGEILCNSLDKLSELGLPIWITELDVVANDEQVRADDLEVVLREAYAHPGVEGVLLWGFYESVMWRQNAHLVNADGTVNEAGRRYLALKQEWLMSDDDVAIDSRGEYRFRGFYGGYNVEVTLPSGERVNLPFVVEKGESPLVLNINL